MIQDRSTTFGDLDTTVGRFNHYVLSATATMRGNFVCIKKHRVGRIALTVESINNLNESSAYPT